jgi:hypothetical protein
MTIIPAIPTTAKNLADFALFFVLALISVYSSGDGLICHHGSFS